MSVFEIKYRKIDKPKGTRKFYEPMWERTFEDVIFDCVLDRLCMPNYQIEYEWFFLNAHVFVKRISANGGHCVYQVKLNDMVYRNKLLVEYEVEIDCSDTESSVDLFEQDPDRAYKEPKTFVQKESVNTAWFSKEPPAIKRFLVLLQIQGMKKLKETTSKATFHRNLKICRDKGFIKGDKLVKRLSVQKEIKIEEKPKRRRPLVVGY